MWYRVVRTIEILHGVGMLAVTLPFWRGEEAREKGRGQKVAEAQVAGE